MDINYIDTIFVRDDNVHSFHLCLVFLRFFAQNSYIPQLFNISNYFYLNIKKMWTNQISIRLVMYNRLCTICYRRRAVLQVLF